MTGQARLLAYTLGTALFVALALALRLPVLAGLIVTPLIVRFGMIGRALAASRDADGPAERKLLGLIVARELALSALMVSAAALVTIRFQGPRNAVLEVGVFLSLAAWAITRQLSVWQSQLIRARRARETNLATESTAPPDSHDSRDPGER